VNGPNKLECLSAGSLTSLEYLTKLAYWAHSKCEYGWKRSKMTHSAERRFAARRSALLPPQGHLRQRRRRRRHVAAVGDKTFWYAWV
jgi:hypothetical protein